MIWATFLVKNVPFRRSSRGAPSGPPKLPDKCGGKKNILQQKNANNSPGEPNWMDCKHQWLEWDLNPHLNIALYQLSYRAVKIIAYGIRTRDLTFWQNQVSNPAAEFRNLKISLFRCKMCKDERVRAWFCLIQDALPTELTLDRYTFESVVNLLGCCIFVVYFIAKVRISAYCPLSTH